MTLRLTWLIQAASGSDVMPAISTRRVDSSMMNSTANRVRPRPVQTSTVKKSAAARTSQWVFRNSVQVVFFRRFGGFQARAGYFARPHDFQSILRIPTRSSKAVV